MTNLHTLVVGRTGSGKTTLAKALLRLTARAVVFDRRFEYDIPGATICHTLDAAATALMTAGAGECMIVCRFREPEDFLSMLEIVMLVQDSSELYGPIVVCMEEASTYSETHSIAPQMRTAYNQGRHMRLSLLTIIQLDTDIHRVTRGNSEIIVSLPQNRLSVDMARYFDWEEIARLVSLKDHYTKTPKQNYHFITYPLDVDLYRVWEDTHGYVLEVPTQLPQIDRPEIVR